MPAKPKILFIGDYCRTDYLRLLNIAKESCDFSFLYFDTPTEEKNKAYLNYGRAIYWSDYSCAQALLATLAPHKALFLYLDTYKALVLKMACHQARIYTYHLEHGMRADYAIGYNTTISPNLHQHSFRKINSLINILKNLGTRVKSRLFLNNTIRKFTPEDAAFAREYIKLRGKYNYFETFKWLPSPKRTADCYISFSPKVYQVHQQYDQLGKSQQVHFIGIPYFDALATIKPTTTQHAILFIDQPLAEHRLLQWTPAYKKAFVTQFTSITARHNYKFYVKPHPDQDNSLWKNAQNTELIDDARVLEICGSIPIVMGFYSTYLMPFAAFNHTTLITLENHPAGKLDVSRSFVEAGVTHPVYSLEELPWALENIELLHQKQLPNKKQFEKDWLYKFDGKAGERLRDILLSDEL